MTEKEVRDRLWIYRDGLDEARRLRETACKVVEKSVEHGDPVFALMAKHMLPGDVYWDYLAGYRMTPHGDLVECRVLDPHSLVELARKAEHDERNAAHAAGLLEQVADLERKSANASRAVELAEAFGEADAALAAEERFPPGPGVPDPEGEALAQGRLVPFGGEGEPCLCPNGGGT